MFTTTALTDCIGAEIHDVDVRKLSDDEIRELMDVFTERLVLVLRSQSLSSEEQIEVASRMGPLQVLPDSALTAPGVQGKHIMVISNQLVDGKIGALPDGEMWFHFDQLYVSSPPYAGVLFGMQIPKQGGHTRFANAIQAYRDLPSQTKERIRGLNARHVYDYTTTAGKVEPSDGTLSYSHPVVTRQPGTGLPILYVSRLMTYCIEGLERQESDALLEELFDQIEREEYIYEHEWQEGDLVIWDNNAALHARTDFDPQEPRMLRRLSLANAEPPMAYA